MTVIGAGGIGSNLVLLLTMLGLRDITVWDADRVEIHNLNTTPYNREELGAPKVQALKRVVGQKGGKIRAVPRMFSGQLPNGDRTEILISAVDSIPARKQIFREAVRRKIPLFIDGRIGGEVLRVYTVRPSDSEDRRVYRTTLVSQKRVTPLPCTGEQVVDVGYVTASLMVRALRRFLTTGTYEPEVCMRQQTLDILVAPKKSLLDRVEKKKKRKEPEIRLIEGGGGRL